MPADACVNCGNALSSLAETMDAAPSPSGLDAQPAALYRQAVDMYDEALRQEEDALTHSNKGDALMQLCQVRLPPLKRHGVCGVGGKGFARAAGAPRTGPRCPKHACSRMSGYPEPGVDGARAASLGALPKLNSPLPCPCRPFGTRGRRRKPK